MKNRINTRIAIAAVFCLGTATVAGAQRIPTVSPGQGFPSTGTVPGPGTIPGPGFIPINGMINGQVSSGFNPLLAQQNAAAMSAFFNNGGSAFFANPVLANGGYYGGYYGFGDPTLAITPYGGAVPIGYGYNGYTGTGYPSPSDWQILQAAYAQGYQAAAAQAAYDAAMQAANPENNTIYPPGPAGMTATPRGAVSRVPHGSDGVRMWRVGGKQIALRWQGDSRVASYVTFSVTDRSGRRLRSTDVSQLPAEVHFTPPANAAFYEAVVHYVDGATNTIMGRLPQ